MATWRCLRLDGAWTGKTLRCGSTRQPVKHSLPRSQFLALYHWLALRGGRVTAACLPERPRSPPEPLPLWTPRAAIRYPRGRGFTTGGWQTVAHRGRAEADEVLALGLASGLTIQAAAQHSAVARRTARRRLTDPAFRARVNALRAALVDQAPGPGHGGDDGRRGPPGRPGCRLSLCTSGDEYRDQVHGSQSEGGPAYRSRPLPLPGSNGGSVAWPGVMTSGAGGP